MAARSPSSAAHFAPSARLSLSPEALYTRRRRDAFQRGGGGIIIISHLSLTFRSTSRAFIWHQKVHSHPSVSPSERQSAFLPPEEEGWQEQDQSVTVPETRGRDFGLKAFCCIKPKTKQLLSNYKPHFSCV